MLSYESGILISAICLFVAGMLVGYMVTVYTNEGKLYYRDMPDGSLRCHIHMDIDPDLAVDKQFLTLKVVEDKKGEFIKDEQKYYLKLRVIDGYNLEDIDEIFGVSAPAVHKRLNRIYGKIRKVYQEG